MADIRKSSPPLNVAMATLPPEIRQALQPILYKLQQQQETIKTLEARLGQSSLTATLPEVNLAPLNRRLELLEAQQRRIAASPLLQLEITDGHYDDYLECRRHCWGDTAPVVDESVTLIVAKPPTLRRSVVAKDPYRYQYTLAGSYNESDRVVTREVFDFADTAMETPLWTQVLNYPYADGQIIYAAKICGLEDVGGSQTQLVDANLDNRAWINESGQFELVELEITGGWNTGSTYYGGYAYPVNLVVAGGSSHVRILEEWTDASITWNQLPVGTRIWGWYDEASSIYLAKEGLAR